MIRYSQLSDLFDERVIDGRAASRLVSGCGGPDLHRGANASAGSETIVVMTCGFLQVGPCLDHDHRHPATALGSPTPISMTKTTGRTAAETLAPPATYGLRSPGRRPGDRSLSRLNRPLLAHPCRCVSLQRPKFDARGNTLATSLVARCRAYRSFRAARKSKGPESVRFGTFCPGSGGRI